MLNFALANVLKYLIRENNIYLNYNKIEHCSKQGYHLPIIAIKDSVSITTVVIQYDDILKTGF